MDFLEFLATFGSGLFTFVVIIVAVVLAIRKARRNGEKQREQQASEQYRQRYAETSAKSTGISDEQRRRQEELKKRLAQKYGLSDDEQAQKHAKHVEDSHEHGHLGREEHYEEIVGSLGEVNDEGCVDLNGVRFLATDLSYELQTQESVDYDRIAQAMVLGDVINNPRFKTPYSRRK